MYTETKSLFRLWPDNDKEDSTVNSAHLNIKHTGFTINSFCSASSRVYHSQNTWNSLAKPFSRFSLLDGCKLSAWAKNAWSPSGIFGLGEFMIKLTSYRARFLEFLHLLSFSFRKLEGSQHLPFWTVVENENNTALQHSPGLPPLWKGACVLPIIRRTNRKLGSVMTSC